MRIFCRTDAGDDTAKEHRRRGSEMAFDRHQMRATCDAVGRQYADEIADELDKKPFDREFLDGVADHAGAGEIAELGCGPGHVSGYLASRRAHVSGFDLSPAMVEQVQRLFPDLQIQAGDMLALPFDDASLDGVVSFYSIVHFDEALTESAFSEMARVLQAGAFAALAFHVGSDVLHRDEWF